MTNQQDEPVQKPDKQVKRLQIWARFFAILFRIMIVAGLLLLVVMIVALIFSSLMYAWLLVIPLGLIILGILLAWLEYDLHKRLYALSNNQAEKKGRINDDKKS